AGGLAGAIRAQQTDNLSLVDMKTDSVNYPAPAVRFRDVVRGQSLHLLLARVSNPSWSLVLGSFSTTYQHPTIVGKKSQRIARDFTPFGIKNARTARWSARQHHFLVRSRVNKLVSNSFSGCLLDLYISLRHNAFQLACALVFRLT